MVKSLVRGIYSYKMIRGNCMNLLVVVGASNEKYYLW